MIDGGSVLVDSSAWIDFLAGEKEVVKTIGRLRDSHEIVICGQIKQEVLQGSRDARAFAKLAGQFTIWVYEPEQPEDFVSAARIYAELRWNGLTVPAADCLIAAVAKRRDFAVYATDPHFHSIPGLKLLA